MRETLPQSYLDGADLLLSAQDVDNAIAGMATQIMVDIGDTKPLVLCVMGGGVVFTGQLLPQLNFPLEFDYVQASRYHNNTSGQHLVWKVMPSDNVKGRTVLVLDDILDEGHTLAAIREKCLTLGATRVVIAVLVEKTLDKSKPVKADYVGLQVPDRYVFGCGMDVYGWWRNLPAIYALKPD
ncbi:MAG: hypoxanthine-guanine phosphoribosyltransferase [Methylophilaceae bacterium]|nr:hypoxanthine-guanine phosphoribosyltransferase [Methylophilaceae bacterium]